jgi:hypothetical protein
MNWLQTTLAVAQLAPSILTMISQIEGLFPARSGAAKKALVMASVASGGTAVAEAAGAFVDASVKELNRVGVFSPAPLPPAPETAPNMPVLVQPRK